MPLIQQNNVGPIGYGLMGFTWRPETVPVEQAVEVLKSALEAGANLWNGAEFYGTAEYNSMTLIKSYFTKYPEDAERVTIIIKGLQHVQTLIPDGSPENVRQCVDNVLRQLGGKKKLDLFGISRRDHRVPLATTIEVLKKEYVDTGKIGGISLSECSPDTIHEAVKHTKVAAVEVELSMFTPDILKNGVAAACAQYNIPIVAYSPLGRGILTGQFKTDADTRHLGIVSHFPRLQGEALEHNLKLLEQVKVLADKKGCTTAQLAIAWVRSVSKRSDTPEIIPIPGATTSQRVQENMKVIDLTEEESKAISSIVDGFEPAGPRYPNGVPTET
ncbi:unnamed protein product [Clonostachys byssicola]|uniref:NADP-dependent oxidoreductase domain-containing protein n=1 Tax=Clonostachys byssicola TaxID=160290 RepID=A0A9N9ULK4_9HYPO|nr:unnamed protein product [Clonostachys byssicola]